MRKPTNTTAEVNESPLLGLMTALPGGIEAQEARGQRELVNSEVLPRDGSDNPAWAKMGIVFGGPVDGDPIFRSVTLPAGWKKEPTEHSMWSKLVDDKGRERAMIFYKAAFYDRSAHMSLTRRFSVQKIYEEGKRELIQHEVLDGKKQLYVTKSVTQPTKDGGKRDWEENERIEKAQRTECVSWLVSNGFPDWEDAAAYRNKPEKRRRPRLQPRATPDTEAVLAHGSQRPKPDLRRRGLSRQPYERGRTMSAIIKSVRQSPEPIEQLMEAIAIARELGMRVRIGSLGVSATSTDGPLRWEVDPLERDRGVSPIGALTRAGQPTAIDAPAAAAQALGVDACWIDGLAAGLSLEPKDARWMQSRRRHYYMHGYESGVSLRIHVVSHPEKV